MRFHGTAALALLLSAGCDYDLDFLFSQPVEGVEGVVHLGEITPVDITSIDDVSEVAIYGEVGPTGTVEPGGVTFTFRGTGGSVCVFVDPESVSWNQSVAESPGSTEAYKYSWPDNLYDDGDIDLSAGFAVHYTGTPANQSEGGHIGNFKTRYQDSLGQTTLIEFNECEITTARGVDGGHSGRGAPEYCTLKATQPGVSYIVLMETWSTPIDDDRLGYGLLLANGDCDAVLGSFPEECLILGESVMPGGEAGPQAANGTWVGRENVPSWPVSENFEVAFCEEPARGEVPRLYQMCLDESNAKDCDVDRCFCGDPSDTPTGT